MAEVGMAKEVSGEGGCRDRGVGVRDAGSILCIPVSVSIDVFLCLCLFYAVWFCYRHAAALGNIRLDMPLLAFCYVAFVMARVVAEIFDL